MVSNAGEASNGLGYFLFTTLQNIDKAKVIYSIRIRMNRFPQGYVPADELVYVAGINHVSHFEQVAAELKKDGLIHEREECAATQLCLTRLGFAATDYLKHGLPRSLANVPQRYKEMLEDLFCGIDKADQRAEQLSKT